MIKPLVTLNSMTCAIRRSSLVAWSSAAGRGGSGRLNHLASGVGDRTGSLFTRNELGDGENVVGTRLRRMGLADEDIGHQFVIAGAVAHMAGLQRNVGGQLHVLQRRRQFR